MLFRLNLMERSVLHCKKIVAAVKSRFRHLIAIFITKRKNGQKAILFHSQKLMMIMCNRFPTCLTTITGSHPMAKNYAALANDVISALGGKE
ncbi:MAG: PTS cellobiose/arbutin/salicin transporter subunit IIBC, partial [Enterobacter sp.]|nr:PTS cellobiose/arbutin/salicin transporter subunit IIBC [Enterobacter sp.]